MSELLKNSIHTVMIDGYTSEGAGIARIDGRVVFIPGVLKGEKCNIKIVKAGKNVNYGILDKVLEASPQRRTPECPVFGKCGGCSLMHMSYEEELDMKRQRVEDALRRIGGADISVSMIIGADKPEGYRNKVIFNVGEKDGKPVCGFYRKRSHDIVDFRSCRISAPEAEAAAEAVLIWMNRFSVNAYDGKNGREGIRHIYVRHGFSSGETLVCLVAASEKLKNEDELVSEIRRNCPSVVGIVLNTNRDTGNTVLKGSFRTLWGREYIEDSLCGLSFRLSPMSFYQVNRSQAEKLYEKAIEFAELSDDKKVIDLYCGTGTITLCLAKKAGFAVGAEIVPQAIENAKRNGENNNVENVRFMCADASEAADILENEGFHPDAVVVDPPRKGLSSDVIGTIGRMSPERVVYVSCDPGTLARDVKLFSEIGYNAVKAVAVDLFPRTPHVETVVLLSKLSVGRPIE